MSTPTHSISGVDENGELWELGIYVVDCIEGDRGIWMTDKNILILTPPMYYEFANLTQEKQKVFMGTLLKLSNYSLEW